MKRNYIICLIALLATIGICSCEKQTSETTYKGNVVNSLTHEAFPNLEVSVTDGEHINQTVHTDAQGFFSVLVRFDEINAQYYLLIGDSSCVPVRRDFKGFGQAEIDLGIIEVEGPKAPTVTTTQVTAITAETAVSGGNVTDDGRATVTARGVCWSKNEYPTTADAHTSNGTGKGEFQSNLTGLEFGQKYYLRAYATNRMGTAYGEQIEFATSTGEAEVVTDSVFAITATSAKCAGNVVSDGSYQIMARGVCWATTPDPTTTDFVANEVSGKGPFSCALRNLELSTTYYVRAFATNENGTTYGEQLVFTTLDGMAVVTTNAVTNIGSVKATCGGNVTYDGTLTVTARGVCWSTEQQPTVTDSHTTDGKGLGAFTSALKNLQDKTTYYVRAYATTSAGTAYGEQRSFTTSNGTPVVTFPELGTPTATSVLCRGNVTGDGGVTVTERGFCFSTSQYPTNIDSHVALGNGTGEFSGSLTGLVINTTYYVRAYAVNSLGVGYSEQKSFTTLDGLATVTTSQATASATTISAGGNVTGNGGFAVTERGVCYSTTNSDPTITDEKVTSGRGNGTFNVSITGLSAATTYYLRAAATHENGTADGESISVTTSNGSAAVTLGTIVSITASTASSSVTVTNAGGATLQSCGICWSTNPNPTTSDSKVIANGQQLNTAYTCNMTGLTANTTYFVRAYATTNVSTAYSTQLTFTTSNGSAGVTLGAISNITALTASSSVTVTNAGGATLQSCGICWSTNPSPTTTDNKKVAGGTQLNTAYTCNMTGLTPATTYYVRAYATTDVTTAYSAEKTFTTATGLPTISTSATTATSTTISSGGNITSDGGYSITARGVCYSMTNSTPTLADQFTTAGTGTGSFTSIITNISVSTTYYVRAYATNSNGTAYGDVVNVTTGNGMPIVITTTPVLTDTVVTTGGQVTDDGGHSVTARGICYGPLPYPDLSNNYSHTTNGSGTGYYTSSFYLPNGSGTYYLRAYATNANGTSYGEQYTVVQPYDTLPTFQYNGHTYKVAPAANNTLSWSNANTYCNNLTLYGYTDWRLPTKDELLQMYNDRYSIKGFGTGLWWSSSAEGSAYYYSVDFQNGSLISYIYYSRLEVRPIRVEN